MMKIALITPALAQFINGNNITARRMARIFTRLGHRVMLRENYHGEACDLMIALHALRSFPSIERFHLDYPDRPLIVVLTGTDLYQAIKIDDNARRSLNWAT